MMNYSNMSAEHLAYWLERSKADVVERDVLIQNQRNEIERLTRMLQEVNYNSCMQNAYIAYEVQQQIGDGMDNKVCVVRSEHLMTSPEEVVRKSSGGASGLTPEGGAAGGGSASSSSSTIVPVVRVADLDACLSSLANGVLGPSPCIARIAAAVAAAAERQAQQEAIAAAAEESAAAAAGPSPSASVAVSPAKGATTTTTTTRVVVVDAGGSSSAVGDGGAAAPSPQTAGEVMAMAAAVDGMTGNCSGLTRYQQMQQRYSAKRCRDSTCEGYGDGRPMRQGQWLFDGQQQE